MYLGFDNDLQLYYEGITKGTGRGIYPHPVITPATFPPINPDSVLLLPDGFIVEDCKYIFREDSFDPVTRIRRGRFYTYFSKEKWTSKPHPNGEYEGGQIYGYITKQLHTYQKTLLTKILPKNKKNGHVVALGSKDASTLWSIVGLEMVTTGEELITLKARSSLGSLPEILEESIPMNDKNIIIKAIENLREEVFRSGPESVVDHCRDCVEYILRGKIRTVEAGYSGGELSKIIDKFVSIFEKEFRNIPNCAQIIRLHHQRRKTAIKETKFPRSLEYQDAELCTYCLSSIICDLQWGRWV